MVQFKLTLLTSIALLLLSFAASAQQLNQRTGPGPEARSGMSKAIAQGNLLDSQLEDGNDLMRDTIITDCSPVIIGGDTAVVSGSHINGRGNGEFLPGESLVDEPSSQNGLVGARNGDRDVTTIVREDIYNICRQ